MSATIVSESVHVLSCEELTIHSGGRVVVDRFSWAHSPPGVVWVSGANGSGKSSLLQVIAGWRKPSSGRVAWARSATDQLRYLAPAMQAPPALRVGDFVRFVRQFTPVPDEPTDGIYPEHVTDHAVFGRLSTGEAKRLLLWAALRHGHGPLILDEPYEHLARDAKAHLTEILRARAAHRLVMVATNQDMPLRPRELLLHVDDARIEVQRA